MNVIKVGNTLTVVLDNGRTLSKSNCDNDTIDEILNAVKNEDEEALVSIFEPRLLEIIEKYKVFEDFEENVKKSKYLTFKGQSVYIESISELSVPMDFVKSFIQAEIIDDNKELVNSYLNFWTLLSLNPDSRARTNLFWFLQKNGMTITKSGLFVAYRNVCIKKEGIINNELTKIISDSYIKIKKNKKSPSNYNIIKSNGSYFLSKKDSLLEDNTVLLGNVKELYEKLSDFSDKNKTVYTDNYTKTMEITIGKIVTIDREQCDPVQENTCSRGLHVASKDWLLNNGSGFGEVSLMVLVNPASVVAVPPGDSYGKMRVCAYYPIKIISIDELYGDDNIIPDGFEDDFIGSIEIGTKYNNDENPYFIEIPNIPEISEENTIKNIERLKNFRKTVL